MGPSQPTDKEINKVRKRLMQVLRDEFDIFNSEPLINTKNFMKYRKQAIKGLKPAIKDILWQQNCEDF